MTLPNTNVGPPSVEHVPDRPTGVSVVIPTLNEADRLPDCLASVTWADEVIVADGGSTDATTDIARRFGARVLVVTGATIGRQKNAAIEVAKHPWILSLDADERVSPELQQSIEAAVSQPARTAYRVHLRNHYLGAPYGRGAWGRDYHVRLFPKTSRWTTNRVHERLEMQVPVADLSGRLDHESYRDLAHQMDKCVRYGVWGAADMQEKGATVTLRRLLLHPLWRFVKTYVLQGMWREGMRGFLFCATYAWGAFAKYALLWDAQRKARSL